MSSQGEGLIGSRPWIIAIHMELGMTNHSEFTGVIAICPFFSASGLSLVLFPEMGYLSMTTGSFSL